MEENCLFKDRVKKSVLGKGSYGTVYRMDNLESPDTAIKAIQIISKNADFNAILGESNISELEEKTNQLMQEVALMYKLKGQTHIVNYIDHFVEKNHDYYTMYIEMELLKKLDKYYGDTIETNDILKICYEVLDALELCEENHIVHGDIKPQNIMVDELGHTKLTDFGISKVMNTYSEVSNYTPAYAAPEVINDKKYTEQSDLYSLALVIYQFFNDSLLPFMNTNFKDKDIKKAIDKRLNEKIPEPKHGTNEFNQFLMKALHHDSSQRYQNATEMKNALQALEQENKVPKIAVALPIFLSIAYKLNTFRVYAATSSVAKTMSLLDTVKNLTLNAKISVGIATAVVLGGGTVAGVNMFSNKLNEIITPLKEDQLNILHVSDKIDYQTDPEGVKLDVSFGSDLYQYDGKITSSSLTKTIIRGNVNVNELQIHGDTAYFIRTPYDPHTTIVQAFDLKTQEQKYYSKIGGIVNNLSYMDKSGRMTVSNGEVGMFLEDDGTQLLGPVDSLFYGNYELLGDLGYDYSSVENQGKWKLTGVGRDLIDVAHTEESYYILYYSYSDTNLYLNDVNVPVKNGYNVLEISEEGELKQNLVLNLPSTDKNKYYINVFENHIFITGDSHLIFDFNGNQIYKLELESKPYYSKVFRIDEQTLGCYLSANGGNMLMKIGLTDVKLSYKDKEIKYKTLIYPSKTKINKGIDALYTFVLTAGFDKELFYNQFIDYVDFATGAYAQTGKKSFTQEDFKILGIQEQFIKQSLSILDLPYDYSHPNEDLIIYKFKTSNCVKAIKGYLGVEPAFNTNSDDININSMYDSYLGNNPNDFTVEYLEEPNGETTIKIYSTDSFTRSMYADGCVLKMKIKGNFENPNFTILSMEVPLIGNAG